jgi:hypothetical protein
MKFSGQEEIQVQVKSIAIQPSSPAITLSQQRIENLDIAFYAVVYLAIFSMIGILISANIPKDWQYSFRFGSHDKIPCRRCRYFSDNPFLKCALHPANTLTKQAIDCRDYCPHNKEKSIKKEHC